MKYAVSIICVVMLLFASTSFAKKGIYGFRASSNKPYVNGRAYFGKSNDMPRRTSEHIRSGKLDKSNAGGVRNQYFNNLNDKELRVVERNTIKKADFLTKGRLANNHHAPWSRANRKVWSSTESSLKNLKQDISR